MIEIREIRGLTELRAVEVLQKEVWGFEDIEIVPSYHMIPAVEVGAILLGAFDGGALVGFVYGFPGFEGDWRVIHSDMLAIRASYRDQGLGSKLKMAQRDRARAMRVDHISWTFDPLQARNAMLNFVHLGAIADRYKRDFYGETSSPLHRGIGTDRLWVTWSVNGEPGPFGHDVRRIEIPSDIAALQEHNMAEARGWREKTRREFEEAFREGWVVTGFERGTNTSTYLLRRSAAEAS
jgi:predicted GNAT superfamily acetyltransferase